jgi:hypothetical protein
MEELYDPPLLINSAHPDPGRWIAPAEASSQASYLPTTSNQLQSTSKPDRVGLRCSANRFYTSSSNEARS